MNNYTIQGIGVEILISWIKWWVISRTLPEWSSDVFFLKGPSELFNSRLVPWLSSCLKWSFMTKQWIYMTCLWTKFLVFIWGSSGDYRIENRCVPMHKQIVHGNLWLFCCFCFLSPGFQDAPSRSDLIGSDWGGPQGWMEKKVIVKNKYCTTIFSTTFRIVVVERTFQMIGLRL